MNKISIIKTTLNRGLTLAIMLIYTIGGVDHVNRIANLF